MTDVTVLCDHAVKHGRSRKGSQQLELNIDPPTAGVRLDLLNMTHSLLGNIRPESADLLRIAAFIYIADGCIRRGTDRDVFNENWSRNFNFVIPVHAPDRWNDQATKNALVDLLQFLTDDTFTFGFVKQQPKHQQLGFTYFRDNLPAAPDADCVSLFSGGIDSFAGAIDLCQRGRKPILVSHWSRNNLVKLQDDLVVPLRQRFPQWAFPHIGTWVNRMNTTSRAPETSQRSRSFLFLALATIVAFEMGLTELMVCENGITTFNLPRLDQVVGATATRSTHPQTLRRFQDLAAMALGAPISVESRFIWKTRAEVIGVVAAAGCSDLLPLTSSCAQSQTTRISPHCGVCSQCIDRRFGMLYAGAESDLDRLQYNKDFFTDSLKLGAEKMQAVSPVMFAIDVGKMDKREFTERYVQVFDALDHIPGDPDSNLDNIFELTNRFATEVIEVYDMKNREYRSEIFKKELPTDCLLMLRGVKTASVQRADDLIEEIDSCPIGNATRYRDLCRDVLTYLFCEDVSAERALQHPEEESEVDQGYLRRDLIFRNTATDGFWKRVRDDYLASGIIADAKNYDDSPGGDTVGDFAKYLNDRGLGQFGLLISRKIGADVRSVIGHDRPDGAVARQKRLWEKERKMVLLLDDSDLREMLSVKVAGGDPTNLLSDRIYTLQKRIY